MKFQRTANSPLLYNDLLLFAFLIYESTSGRYPRLEWLTKKPRMDDFNGFENAYSEFLKARLTEEFDELYIARDKNTIIGTFALVYNFEGKHIPWIPDSAKRQCIFLEFLMVHPEFRARGLGKEALRIAQEKASKMNKKICVVTFEDLQAYTYYLKNEFKVKERFSHYVLMER